MSLTKWCRHLRAGAEDRSEIRGWAFSRRCFYDYTPVQLLRREFGFKVRITLTH
jgi:hypothetical protein